MDSFKVRFGLEIWDDLRIKGGEKWSRKIEDAIERTAAAICLISDNYLRSAFILKQKIPMLLERRQTTGMPPFILFVRR